VIRSRADIVFATQVDRILCKPWGLEGGSDATGNEVAVRSDGAWQTEFSNGKLNIDRLKAGDAVRMRSGGGGGYGSPLERPVEEVLEDVRQGYVTIAAAASQYGVVVDPATLALDRAATERLRAHHD
jgi:N-methylhydantoinase B